jgi:hypothetical protein
MVMGMDVLGSAWIELFSTCPRYSSYSSASTARRTAIPASAWPSASPSTILSADHAEPARRFATKGIDKFGPEAFELGELRLPILPDALVVLECRTVARLPGGDHTILLGEAVSARLQAGH